MPETLAYTIIWFEGDEDFVASCLQVPGVYYTAATPDKALDGIRALVSKVGVQPEESTT